MTRNKKPSKKEIKQGQELFRAGLALMDMEKEAYSKGYNDAKKNILALKRKLKKNSVKDDFWSVTKNHIVIKKKRWEKIWDDFLKEKE